MKLSNRQVSVLKNVRSGLGALCYPVSLKSLESKGLIEQCDNCWSLTESGLTELMKAE